MRNILATITIYNKRTFLAVLLPLALAAFLFQVMVRDGKLKIGEVDLT